MDSFEGERKRDELTEISKIMKRWLTCLILIIAACQTCLAEVEWLTDYSTAMKRAKLENKVVLMDFTGSDWCGWCMKLKSEVFDQPEFASFAQANLIMLEVDFPHHKALSDWQQRANEQLASDHHISGFPTIVFVNSSGAEVGRSGYRPGGPGSYINDIKSRIPGVGAPAAPAPVPEAPPKSPPPPFVPVPPATPTHYGELALKGISGLKDRRLAIINNQTLMLGETAMVKVHDGRVEVTCKEIHDNSVIVLVDGKKAKLILGAQ
jgi:thioredoxin-related protein